MKLIDPRDVPCLSCQHGYAQAPHNCDAPDFCPCDRWRAHPTDPRSERKPAPVAVTQDGTASPAASINPSH